MFETSTLLRLGKSQLFIIRLESEYLVQVPLINSKLYILKDENIQNEAVVSKQAEKRICYMKEVTPKLSAHRYANIHNLKAFCIFIYVT